VLPLVPESRAISTSARVSPTIFEPGVVWTNARVARLRAGAAAVDRPLLFLWIVSSVVLGLWLVAVTLAARRAFDGSGVGQTKEGTDSVIVTTNVGPAAIGTLRQRILMPQWVLDLEPTRRGLVLQHEREHLLAHDPLLLLSSMVLIVLLPWQLPLWWMARRLRCAIEYDCDARVLSRAPDVQLRSHSTHSALNQPLIAEPFRSERIHTRRPSAW